MYKIEYITLSKPAVHSDMNGLYGTFPAESNRFNRLPFLYWSDKFQRGDHSPLRVCRSMEDQPHRFRTGNHVGFEKEIIWIDMVDIPDSQWCIAINLEAAYINIRGSGCPTLSHYITLYISIFNM